MKFTAAVIMATAALTSATAINMDPAAQDAALKVDNLRMQFSHDYDCKWKKDGKLMTSVPACKGKNYKKHSYKFNKKDEESKKCFSAKDLDLTAHGQENWHSFSYCLPPRLEKKGCEFRMYDNVHCEGDAKMIINSECHRPCLHSRPALLTHSSQPRTPTSSAASARTLTRPRASSRTSTLTTSKASTKAACALFASSAPSKTTSATSRT